MRLVLTGRHVDVTPVLRRLADSRLAKLDRMLGDSIVSAQVVLARERFRYVVEMSVHARGDHVLHGVASTSAWDTALTGAVEKIMQQALKVKGKWRDRRRRGAADRTLASPLVAEGLTGERQRAPRIVRASRYLVKPMTVEEAALEVGAGQDAFLVFRNAGTDSINVLYRRRNGDLGLIEPEA